MFISQTLLVNPPHLALADEFPAMIDEQQAMQPGRTGPALQIGVGQILTDLPPPLADQFLALGRRILLAPQVFQLNGCEAMLNDFYTSLTLNSCTG